MKRCRWCKREIAEDAAVCPFPNCGRPVEPEGGTAGVIPPPPPPPGTETHAPVMAAPPAMTLSGPAAPGGTPPGPSAAEVPTIVPPPPPPPGMADAAASQKVADPPQVSAAEPEEPFSPMDALPREPKVDELPDALKVRLEGLQHRVRKGKRRGVLLGNGAVAAVALGLICWAAYYAHSVLSYAEVADVEIRRDSTDRDQLAVYYRPLSTGRLGFRRAVGNRQTELLVSVAPGAVGKRNHFVWSERGPEAAKVVRVTHLDGWSRRTTERPVQEPPVQPAREKREEPERPPVGPPGPPPEPPTAAPEGGVVAGWIVNAINNQPVPEAEVQIAGTPLVVRTNVNGYFEIAGAPTGTVRVVVSADGFISDQFERELVAGQERPVRRVLSPGMEKQQFRIVLTWDTKPKDLDAHLEGPSPDGRRFHVYYHQRGNLKSREFVRLDVDSRDGHGPETVTVLGVVPGVYRYFVHDYSHRGDPESTALARSGAEVRVYQGGRTYRFPADGDVQGNVWDVCTIEVAPDGVQVNTIDAYQGVKAEDMVGLYDKRTQADRVKWITRYGGSAVSEKAVADGLAWLARHQDDEGFWSSECLADGQWSQCQTQDPCRGPGRKYEMAQTGLALLAFQAGGHYYFNNNTYSALVRRGLDWMVEHQRPDGALVSEKSKGGHSRYHTFYMYDHGIATFALADACAAAAARGEPADEKYLGACRKAVEYIESQQHEDGGWRYTDDFERPGDASVSGWQVLALKSAKEAGIEVNYRCIEKIREFFDRVRMDQDGRTWYRKDRHETKQESDATTGIGMLVRQFLLDEPDAPMIQQAARYLAALAETHAKNQTVQRRNDPSYPECGLEYRLKYNYYTWYNCMLAMFHAGGEPWQRWNQIIRDTIIGLQRRDGCARGSWDPDTQWGERGGRIYTTALAILALESYYRYTPQNEIHTESLELDVITEGEIPQGVPAKPEPLVLPARTPAGQGGVPNVRPSQPNAGATILASGVG